MSIKTLKSQAGKILQSNTRGPHTIPSPQLYPHQWAWDSAFAAMGWVHLDPARAVQEIESLMDVEWKDGRVPHIAFDPNATEYFPGPEIWETKHKSSTISQPPVWTTAALHLLKHGADEGKIKALIPGLEKSHLFFWKHRDPLNWNLVAVAHPWESGMDNCIAWDDPLEFVDETKAPDLRRTDIERCDDPRQRPSDLEYKRYLVLVKEIAASGFRLGNFAVYDPFMSTVLARAERDLATLCSMLGVESQALSRAKKIETALIEKLWSEEQQRFSYHDALHDKHAYPKVVGAFFPVILESIDSGIREKLKQNLEAHYVEEWAVLTADPSCATFDPICYWRGPIWTNINWFLTPVFGERLRSKTLDLIDRSGFREYYHPHTGEGLGAHDFTWTAAVALDLLAD